jgi:hypothetical protein
MPKPAALGEAKLRSGQLVQAMPLVTLEGANERAALKLVDEKFEDAWIDAIRDGVRLRDPRCLVLYADARKLIGRSVSLTVNAWASLGLSGETEARGLIDAQLRAQGMSDHDAYAIALEYVREYRREHGMSPLVGAGTPVEAEK